VTLLDPSGVAVTPAAVTDKSAPVIASSDPNAPITLVGLRKPKPGTWTIQPTAGSAPIATVGRAVALAKPKVSAHLGGRGRSRRLSYRVSGPAGLAVTFVEVAKGGEHVLGVSKGAQGTLRFTPGDGPGGRRAIVADIAVNGVGFARRTLTSYTAPAPAHPGRSGRPRIVRHGTSVTVSFTRARGAATSAVKLHASDGTNRMVVVAKGKAVFRQVHRGTHLRATVRGVGISGRRGPSSVASKR
jgi:hypothetical protein